MGTPAAANTLSASTPEVGGSLASRARSDTTGLKEQGHRDTTSESHAPDDISREVVRAVGNVLDIEGTTRMTTKSGAEDVCWMCVDRREGCDRENQNTNDSVARVRG